MRSVTFFAIALPLLVGAQDYPWLKDPGWTPKNGWGTPEGGWDSGNRDYSGGSKAGGQAPAAANSQPVQPAVPAQQPSSSSVSIARSPVVDNGGQTTTTTPPAAMPTTTAAPAPSTTASPTTASSSSSANGGGNPGPSDSPCSSNQQSIEIQNSSDKELVLQAGIPWTTGQCSNIAVGATCTICQERGLTGGNLQVGYGKANDRSTWIEGNWNLDLDKACMDISYIPGYTVPIVCTTLDGKATIGMKDSLCADEACSNCASGGGTYQDGSCLNPMGISDTVKVDGPAPDFFSSATGIVYTFPHDDHVGFEASWHAAKCVAHPQFKGSPAKSSKRAIEASKAEEKRDEAASLAHNHLGRKHRRHLHKHAVHGASKI